MSVSFGHNTWIGFGEESTFGTAVSPTKFLELQSEGLKGIHTRIPKPSLRRVSHDRRMNSKKSVEGSFEFYVGKTGGELLLKHALGSVLTTGAGPYTHTFSLADALPTGLTFHVNRDAAALGAGTAWRYEGCQISKLTIAQKVEDMLTMTPEILGEDWANLAVATPTFPTGGIFDWSNISALNFGVVGATVDIKAKCTEFEITLDNGLAAERYKLGSRLRSGFGRGTNRKVSGKLTLEFTDLVEYAFYRDLTVAEMAITWTSGADSFQILIPTAELDAGDPETADAGPRLLTLEFSAFMKTAANDELSIVWINSTSSV